MHKQAHTAVRFHSEQLNKTGTAHVRDMHPKNYDMHLILG